METTKKYGFFQKMKHLRKRLAPKERSRRFYVIATAVLLPLSVLCLTVLCLFVGTKGVHLGRWLSFFRTPITVFLNFLPLAILGAMIYALSNRAYLSFLLTGIVALTLTFIDYFKVMLRGEPLVVDDLWVAGDAATVMGDYSFRIPLLLPVSIVLLIAGTIVLARYARAKISRRFWLVRIAIGLAAIGLAAASWNRWYTDLSIYRKIYLTKQNLFSPWRDEEISACNGLFWSLLRSVDEAFPQPPEGYTDEQAEAFLNGTPEMPIPEGKKVNVIAVMLESFTDYSALFGGGDLDPAYAELHALQREAYHGTLVTDSIGGGTTNAERSFLTGFTYRHPNYNRPTPSFVHYFNDNGYVTKFAHPGNGTFYSRDKINRFLGFQTAHYWENYYKNLETEDNLYHGFTDYIDDATFFSDLRSTYEQRDPAKPYFCFGVSFQGHSPYDERQKYTADYVTAKQLSEEGRETVNNYLNIVSDTGKQLAAFVDSFREDDEPVVLVFFGDHQPLLGEQNAYINRLLPMSKRGNYRLLSYSTPYLIWANDAAKQALGKAFVGEGGTISPCYLMSEVFDCCGWEGPAWLRYQRSVREDLPVMQVGKYGLQEGKMELLPSAEDCRALEEYQFVEYYTRNLRIK